MKRYSMAIFLILTVFLFSGCTLFNKQGTTASTETNTTTEESSTDKGNSESSNADYKSAIDKLKQDYIVKRDQIEQERLAKYKANFDISDGERKNRADESIKLAQKELETLNKEQLELIGKTYEAEKKKAQSQGLSEEQLAKALQTADSNNAQSEYNQKVSYENKKVLIERIKRKYLEDAKILKDNMDKNIAEFKKSTSEKYSMLNEKITSTYSGTNSEWEISLKHEQEEIANFADEEDEKYNELIKKLDNWLENELNKALK